MFTLLLLACDPGPCDLPTEIPVDHGVQLEDPGAQADFDAFVRAELAASCTPSLQVALTVRGETVLEAAYGWADIQAGRPASTETAYMFASVAKAVDAVALMQSVDDGLIELDAPVQLPFALSNPRAKGEITPRHLATHTSGIRDNWDILEPEYVDGDHPMALADFLQAYLVEGGAYYEVRNNWANHRPGNTWMYANVGGATAALAVEHAREQAFQDVCEQDIFEPTGMTRTHWFLADFEAEDDLAVPYVWEEEAWVGQEHYGFPTWPDGQLRSTAGDMARFLEAVLGGELLSQDALDVMLSEQTTKGGPVAYFYLVQTQGLFWFRSNEFKERRLWGHDGDDYGVSSEMFIDLDTQVGVVLITNVSDGSRKGQVRDATLAIETRMLELGEAL